MIKIKYGETIYQIEEMIGAGGIAKVYKAQKICTQNFTKAVALKILNTENNNNILLEEAKLSSCLNHPNVVQVYEIGTGINGYFIVMELVAGKSLAHILNIYKKPLSIEFSCDIIKQIAKALDYVHKININNEIKSFIHSDIHLGNILYDFDINIVKLADFGYAKTVKYGEKYLFKNEQIFGNPFFMSPEHTNGSFLDIRSDFYSLGMVFYDLLTLTRTFDNNSSIINKQNEIKHLINKENLNKLPVKLKKIIIKLTEINYTKRYESANLIIADIEKYEEEYSSYNERKNKKIQNILDIKNIIFHKNEVKLENSVVVNKINNNIKSDNIFTIKQKVYSIIIIFILNILIFYNIGKKNTVNLSNTTNINNHITTNINIPQITLTIFNNNTQTILNSLLLNTVYKIKTPNKKITPNNNIMMAILEIEVIPWGNIIILDIKNKKNIINIDEKNISLKIPLGNYRIIISHPKIEKQKIFNIKISTKNKQKIVYNFITDK